jgi:hypothetical protein
MPDIDWLASEGTIPTDHYDDDADWGYGHL